MMNQPLAPADLAPCGGVPGGNAEAVILTWRTWPEPADLAPCGGVPGGDRAGGPRQGAHKVQRGGSRRHGGGSDGACGGGADGGAERPGGGGGAAGAPAAGGSLDQGEARVRVMGKGKGYALLLTINMPPAERRDLWTVHAAPAAPLGHWHSMKRNGRLKPWTLESRTHCAGILHRHGRGAGTVGGDAPGVQPRSADGAREQRRGLSGAPTQQAGRAAGGCHQRCDRQRHVTGRAAALFGSCLTARTSVVTSDPFIPVNQAARFVQYL